MADAGGFPFPWTPFGWHLFLDWSIEEETMPNVAEIIRNHMTLELQCVDRVYLSADVPRPHSEGGMVGLLLQARGRQIPSPAVFGQITEAFKARLCACCQTQCIPWVEFQKAERKKDVIQRYRGWFQATQGLLCVGGCRGARQDLNRHQTCALAPPLCQPPVPLRHRPRVGTNLPQGLRLRSLRHEALPQDSLSAAAYHTVAPPSRTSPLPVQKDDSSDAKKRIP